MGRDSNRVSDLLERSEELRVRLDSTNEEIRRIQSECRHQWGDTVYDPIVRGEYEDPGDPLGTMGVDRRLPTYVSRTEKKRWMRTCKLCDLKEYTSRTEKQTNETPVF